jgi:transcription initiation factor TFIIIB Brf1 subunit/transcription initiation factor TFIIB
MTNMDVIRNFVHQYRKPFSTETITELTGIEARTVSRSIRTLLNNQEIKCISTQDKLYVSSNRYQSQVGFNQKGKWNYSTQVAEEILNMLDSRQYRSIREIPQTMARAGNWSLFIWKHWHLSIWWASTAAGTKSYQKRGS